MWGYNNPWGYIRRGRPAIVPSGVPEVLTMWNADSDGEQFYVQFTEPLTERNLITGNNEAAFTVEGQEPEYVYADGTSGPLVAGDYEVATVAPAPIQTLYDDDFSAGTLTDVEVVDGALQLGIVEDNSSSDSTIASATSQHSQTYPGVTVTIQMQATSNVEKIDFLTVSSGTYSLELQNASGTETLRTATAQSSGDNQTIEFTFANVMLEQGTTYLLEVTYPAGHTRHTNSLYSGTLWSSNNTYVHTLGDRNITPGITIYDMDVAYSSEGHRTAEPIALESLEDDLRLQWNETASANTSIVIETAVNESDTEAPTAWAEQTNGEVLSDIPAERAGKYLWIKQTLATTDDAETPVLESLHIEEAVEDERLLLLTMTATKEFNNVEGALSVAYDDMVGNLQGAGGAVVTFTDGFTPTELTRTLPVVAEAEEQVGVSVGLEGTEWIEITTGTTAQEEQVGVSVGLEGITWEEVEEEE